jgi:hypothetical protein
VEIKPRASLFASRVTADHGPTKESTVVIRHFTHPKKEDVKKKNFSSPLREMRVW